MRLALYVRPQDLKGLALLRNSSKDLSKAFENSPAPKSNYSKLESVLCPHGSEGLLAGTLPDLSECSMAPFTNDMIDVTLRLAGCELNVVC